MARVLAFDYGSKRVGVAVTDPSQIIATGLTTIHSKDVLDFLKNYLKNEAVECFVVGEPKNLNNTATHASPLVAQFTQVLKKHFPTIPVCMIDERFTSKMAIQSMFDNGLKKSERRDKKLVDKISATLILQTYLEKKENQV